MERQRRNSRQQLKTFLIISTAQTSVQLSDKIRNEKNLFFETSSSKTCF